MIGGFGMTDPLIEAVEEARRELRWAAGGMTEEEKEDQRRIAEVKEMKLFRRLHSGFQENCSAELVLPGFTLDLTFLLILL